jgi:hypothetical protein
VPWTKDEGSLPVVKPPIAFCRVSVTLPELPPFLCSLFSLGDAKECHPARHWFPVATQRNVEKVVCLRAYVFPFFGEHH